MPVEETSLAPINSAVATIAHPNPVREALSSGQFCYFIELVASATMREARLLEIASHLARVPGIVAGGITSFAGGALGQNPVRIGAAARARGLSPNVHLTCVSRDRLDLRNTLEDMNALGMENVFAITGDYPKTSGGTSKPYFHLDSVQLVEMINELRQGGMPFYISVAVSPFKYTEADCAYQYLKLEKKISAGADYAITQLGFDAKKFRELKRYMDERGLRTPVLGNVYVLNQRAAEKMSKGEPPGCWVSPELVERIREESKAEDKGLAARLERAAQMVAIVRGLGYAGAYIGGEHQAKRIHWIIERSEELAPRWEELAEEMTFAPKNGFYFFETPASPKKSPALMPQVLDTLGHVFNVKKPGPLRNLVTGAMEWVDHHPALSSALERAEFVMKSPMFGCEECGNCVLEYTEYVCPQTCPKNLRNGPCGGTLNGHCEVEDKQCVWVSVYERARDAGRVEDLKTYVPPRKLELKGTSSWVNYFLNRDSRPGREEKLINIQPADTARRAPKNGK